MVRLPKKFSAQTLWTLAALLWTAVIFAMSLRPADASNQLSMGTLKRLLEVLGLDDLPPEQWDALHHLLRKCAHFTEYFLLGVLWCGHFRAAAMPQAWGKAWWSATMTAAADELLQRFVEGRSGQLSDILLDSAGALTGILLMLCVCAMVRKGHKT